MNLTVQICFPLGYFRLPFRLFSLPFQVTLNLTVQICFPSGYFRLPSRLFSPPFQVTLNLTVQICFPPGYFRFPSRLLCTLLFRIASLFHIEKIEILNRDKKKIHPLCDETASKPIRFRNTAERLRILCSFLGSKLMLTNVLRKMWAAATCSGRNGNTRYLYRLISFNYKILTAQMVLARWY